MSKKIRVKLSRKCVKELDNFYSCQLFFYQAVNFSSYQDLKSLVKPVLNMQYRAVGTGWAEVPIQMVEMLTLVLDLNLVSVLATETKIKFQYRFRGQNFFYLNLNFHPF